MNRIKLIYLQQNRTETGNARRDRWPCPLPLGRSPADEFGCEKLLIIDCRFECINT